MTAINTYTVARSVAALVAKHGREKAIATRAFARLFKGDSLVRLGRAAPIRETLAKVEKEDRVAAFRAIVEATVVSVKHDEDLLNVLHALRGHERAETSDRDIARAAKAAQRAVRQLAA